MTEQEAKAFGERLTRIWEPIEELSARLEPNGRFKFTAQLDIEDEVKFIVDNWLGVLSTDFYVGAVQARLTVSGELNVWVNGTGVRPIIPERWFARFRRSAWLTGFVIEATAHEKAEWIEGFSREEIESWNLKM